MEIQTNLVVCINSANKPKQIPEHEWIVEGEIYTVVGARLIDLQVGILGLKLKEVSLTDASFPYEYYDARRFRVANESEIRMVEEAIDEQVLV